MTEVTAEARTVTYDILCLVYSTSAIRKNLSRCIHYGCYGRGEVT